MMKNPPIRFELEYNIPIGIQNLLYIVLYLMKAVFSYMDYFFQLNKTYDTWHLLIQIEQTLFQRYMHFNELFNCFIISNTYSKSNVI